MNYHGIPIQNEQRQSSGVTLLAPTLTARGCTCLVLRRRAYLSLGVTSFFQISAGERQRVAIARALLKDAPIFLLDEPTANLDPLTEQDLLKTLFDSLGDKTTLLITHRLVALESVDQILVLDQGRVIEQGTEQELLAIKNGFYRRMWVQQNRILSYS